MNIKQALEQAIGKMNRAGIESASLDAKLILAFCLKKTKEYLLAHSRYELAESKLKKFESLVARRLEGEPVAYILGKKEFYGLDFQVNASVLIPRPETELLVEEALRRLSGPISRPTVIIDVGTGSGCLAVSLAKNIADNHKIRIVAVDKCAKALATARKNAARHRVLSRIRFVEGDLLKPAMRLRPNREIIVVANLPYLSESQYAGTQPEIRKYEPRKALISGRDGLDDYRGLLSQIAELRASCRLLLMEIDPSQENWMKREITVRFSRKRIKILKDLAGKSRAVCVEFIK